MTATAKLTLAERRARDAAATIRKLAFEGAAHVAEERERRTALRAARRGELASSGGMGYRAAGSSKMHDWDAVGSMGRSADDWLQGERGTIVQRAHDLARNNPWAAALLRTVVDHVIGQGFGMQCRLRADVLGLTDAQAREFQAAAERNWERWAKKAGANDQDSIHDVARLAFNSQLVGGDSFVHWVQLRAPWRFGSLAADIIEGELVRTPYNRQDTQRLRMGVLTGDYQRPIGYWVHEDHEADRFFARPGGQDQGRFVRRLDETGRQQITHLFAKQRPKQTRGLPLFYPILTLLDDIGEYFEAEMWAARLGACFSVFIKRLGPLTGAEMAVRKGSGDWGEVHNAADINGTPEVELTPGGIYTMSEGQDVVPFTPNRPGQTFAVFVEQVVGVIAASVGVPEMLVTKNFARSNYSNTRNAVLDARRTFSCMQTGVTANVYQPAFEQCVLEWFDDGLLPRFVSRRQFADNLHEWARAVWTPPTYGWIDPQKEMAAYALAVQNGFMTHQDVAALMGRDWQTVFEQLAVEIAEKERLGIPKAQAPGAAPPPEADEADDDTEDNTETDTEDETEDAPAEEAATE